MTAAGDHRITLPADLRIGSAAPTWALFVASTGVATVVIDASHVSKVDASGLQLLAAAVARLRAAGTAWRWHEASEALRGAAQLAGLAVALELEPT